MLLILLLIVWHVWKWPFEKRGEGFWLFPSDAEVAEDRAVVK
jgi:hypothetical protein